MRRNKLLFDDYMLEAGHVVNYIDVGARGDIAEPWNLFSERALRVIGFEPDPEEAKELELAFPGRKYYHHALWSECTTRKLYLNRWRSTSSMYPPHPGNTGYEEKHWRGRVPEEILEIPCVTLDSILEAQDAPDFVKIDTQGAELEILKGSEKVLRENAPLVLAETWCAEVYQGAPPTHEVMAYMYGLGYQVFDLNLAAAWKHANAEGIAAGGKAKTVGFDLLFVKRPDAMGRMTESQAVKLIGLCELYGFRDYSLFLLEQVLPLCPTTAAAIKTILYDNARRDSRPIERLRHRFSRLLGRGGTLYPPLH
jgi:FkbM family methyltransferase